MILAGSSSRSRNVARRLIRVEASETVSAGAVLSVGVGGRGGLGMPRRSWHSSTAAWASAIPPMTDLPAHAGTFLAESTMAAFTCAGVADGSSPNRSVAMPASVGEA